MEIKTKGTIAILLAATIWGISGVVYKNLFASGWSVFLIAFVIGAVQLTFVHAFAYVKKQTHTYKITRKQKLYAGINGIANIFTVIFYILAISYIAIADAVFLIYTMPLWVMILAMVLLKEKITPLKAIALCTGMIGILVITGIGFSNGFSLNLGALFGILASVSYTVDILSGRKLKNVSNYAASVWAGIIQVIVLLPFVLLTWPLISFHGFLMTFVSIVLVYSFIKTFAVLSYFYSLEVLQASTVGLLAIFDAVASALFAFVFLGQVPLLTSIYGYMLIIASSGLVIESMDIWHLPKVGISISGEGSVIEATEVGK
jgi:drug/metabolite transporter (DMT)-like permease